MINVCMKINRPYIYILFVIILLVISFKLGSLISENSQMIDELQSRNEQLQGEYENVVNRMEESITYQEKLDEELAGYMDLNQQLNERIESWRNESANALQAFHGTWWIRAFYTADTDEWQGYEGYRNICFDRKYIYLTDDHITDEPIYTITICDRNKILTELADMGIDNIDILNMDIISMLKSDYYVEMDFSETYHWNRTMFSREADFVQGAKYYPIDLDTMLCFSRNDGGKVYVLGRHRVPEGRK